MPPWNLFYFHQKVTNKNKQNSLKGKIKKRDHLFFRNVDVPSNSLQNYFFGITYSTFFIPWTRVLPLDQCSSTVQHLFGLLLGLLHSSLQSTAHLISPKCKNFETSKTFDLLSDFCWSRFFWRLHWSCSQVWSQPAKQKDVQPLFYWGLEHSSYISGIDLLSVFKKQSM